MSSPSAVKTGSDGPPQSKGRTGRCTCQLLEMQSTTGMCTYGSAAEKSPSVDTSEEIRLRTLGIGHDSLQRPVLCSCCHGDTGFPQNYSLPVLYIYIYIYKIQGQSIRNGTLYLLRLGGPCSSSFCVESALYPACVTSGWGLYSTLHLLFLGGYCRYSTLQFFFLDGFFTLPRSSSFWVGSVLYPAVISGWGLGP